MNAGTLSALLLDLYRYSRELTLESFPERVLQRLQADFAFDTAWWGVAAISNHGVHSSFPFGLPAHYGQFYQDNVADTDSLAETASAGVGHAVRFGPRDFANSTGLRLLTENFGIRQALCTVSMTPILNLVMFVSLYRHREQPVFSDSEREAYESVAPHLHATWTANWIAQMEHVRADRAHSRVSHAIADQRCILYCADPRFVELIHRECPRWQGPALPLALRRAVEAQCEYQGRTVTLRCYRANGLTLLEAQLNSALDVLSPRERTVAQAFGAGQSYKQIASDLGLSPATVRHYLRRIYSKTNICSKAQLIRHLQTTENT